MGVRVNGMGGGRRQGTYFDDIGECGGQPQTENQPEDTIMSVPERSPHKRPEPFHCQQRTASSDGSPAMTDSRDEDDEDSRDDSTEHSQQPYGYSLWVCIRVCEGGIRHTE